VVLKKGGFMPPLCYNKVEGGGVRMNKFFESLKLFLKGALVDTSHEVIEAAAGMAQDNFMIVIFSDFLGIPNPLSYYTVELLPYFGNELPGWEMRMSDKKSVLAKAMGELGEP
jgi:hypothetical protein